ncbi:MAG: nucleotide sugar dehydrogenase [Alphaproteobacteria bacterium]|nr:nucleotide sugar dehydrogenase [Alphaproteobacteria bacterium]
MASERVGVLGLGYVGLPVALGFARHHATVGFDIDPERVAELRAGRDRTREVDEAELVASGLRVTDQTDDLRGCTLFVVTVPTPVDDNRQPDLRAVLAASRTVGAVMEKGAVVVYESTVYPGVTEELCGPVLAEVSGLELGVDFAVAYSPERINPGDKEHTLERIVKVVSAQTPEALERVAAAYGTFVAAGLHIAPSIQVAETAKVLENTQRDLNIALMNELSLILERLDIPTRDVLAAARTKWNFLPFSPGLVGGHCIGVDPYYLTARAEAVGYHPEVILAGRRTNDGMGRHVARRVAQALGRAGTRLTEARVAVLGLTFKEDVPDLRNSRVPDVIDELRAFGVDPVVCDPLADPTEARHEHGVDLAALDAVHDMDALVLAVPHRAYVGLSTAALARRVRPGGVVFDVKAVLDRDALEGRTYLAL